MWTLATPLLSAHAPVKGVVVLVREYQVAYGKAVLK